MSDKLEDCLIIIEQLEQLWPDFKLMPQELMNPDSDMLTMFFQKFLLDINVNVEDQVSRTLQNLSPPEVFIEFAYPWTYYMCIKQILAQMAPMDPSFNFTCILIPKTKRTKFLFKVLLNYKFFFDLYDKKTEQILEDVKKDAENMEIVHHDHDNVISAVNQKAMKHAKLKDYIVEYNERCNEIFDKIKEGTAEMEETYKYMEYMQATVDGLDKKESVELENFNRIATELSDWEKLVVADSESLQKELEIWNSDIAKEELIDSEVDESLREKRESENLFVEITQRVEANIKNDMKHTCITLFEVIDKINDKIKDESQQILVTSSISDKLPQEEIKTDSEIQEINEACQFFIIKGTNQKEVVIRESADVNIETNNIRSERLQAERNSSNLKKQVDKIKDKSETFKQNRALLFEYFNEHYSRILEAKKQLSTSYNEYLKELSK